MIGKLRGTIDAYGEDWVILDVGGVGYQVFCSARTLQALPKPGEAAGEPLAPDVWRQVKACAALLRLAEGLDRSHYGAVSDVKVRGRGRRVSVDLLTQENDAALEVWEARRRTDLLEKLLGAEVVLTVQKKRGRR